jgi:hypothetical protein
LQKQYVYSALLRLPKSVGMLRIVRVDLITTRFLTFLMSKNPHRFWLAIALCGAIGIVFGCATSQAAINQCSHGDDANPECLLQDPWITRVENISIGLFAGIGAAVGATWQAWQKGE